MGNRLLALTLLLAFMAQTFTRGTMILGYYIDSSGYAINCVNKARPKLNCNGKCQLMLKIAAQEKKEKEDAAKNAEGKVQVLSSRSSYATVLQIQSNLLQRIYHNSTAASPVDQPTSFFHPPGA